MATTSLPFSPTGKSLLVTGQRLASSVVPFCWSFHAPFSSKKCNLYNWRHSYLRRNKASKVKCSQVKLEDSIDDETCELVNGVELVLGEGADSVHAYLLKAVKNNNGAGILLLSDIFGFEDPSTRDFAYRIACNGYNVLVPDLFRGIPWTTNQPKTDFENWLQGQSTERIAKDISTSAKWMVDEFMAAGISKKLGIIGFCFGGGKLIETIAQDMDSYFGIAVCFYGTRMKPSLAANITIPVLFVSGDEDPLCPVCVVNGMANKISDSKAMIYRGRGHGFAHRPESPEEDKDAEDAFSIMRNWLHDGLVVKK